MAVACHPVLSLKMIRYLLSRVGCLMLVAGSILLILGVAAVRAEQPGFNLLLIGIVSFLGGLFLWQRLRPKAQRSSRFSKFRRRAVRQDKNLIEADQGWKDQFDD
jgi:hypothetical protein